MGQINLKKIKSVAYEKAKIIKGYTDQSLRVNLSNSDITVHPIEEKIKNKFIGGKGYDLWLMRFPVIPAGMILKIRFVFLLARWAEPRDIPAAEKVLSHPFPL